jgi:zinc protease
MSAGVARTVLFAVATVISGGCAFVSTRSSLPPGLAPPVRQVLSNGVRVVVQEHRASDVVALQLWVRAGGRDEATNELGLAHYLEHMLFKGTTTRPTGFIDREVEGVGGRMNAGTSLDYTYYHMVLPVSRVGAAIDLLADIGVNASLEASVLDAEKRVVLEEMRLSEDSPRRFLARQLQEAVFDGHPSYGRPVIGTPELVRGLTRDTLLAFYRRLYVPEAFTLVVVGAVGPAEVLDHAQRTFGRLPRTGNLPLPALVPPALAPRRVDVPRPGTQAYLAIGWHAPRIDHPDMPAVDILVSILGHGRTSRLTRSLRERLEVVSSVGSSYSALEAAGLIGVTAQMDPGNLERVESEILREVRRLRGGGVTEIERRRAITALEAQHEFASETVEGRAQTLGHAETVWRLADEMAYLDRARGVTRAQVQAAAQRYLDPDRYARVAFVPSR